VGIVRFADELSFMVAHAPVLSLLDLSSKGFDTRASIVTPAPRMVLDIAGSVIEQFLACVIGGRSDDALTIGSR
jgi:hypothetical protein